MQDAIHGLMEFRGLETLVIDLLGTEELQRLRRIRQLGLGYLVFPAAEHSRLVHGLGAAHLAIRFVKHLEDATREILDPTLRPDEEVRRDMAVAALVHDIGHGPLSHAWEDVMRDFPRAAWAATLGLSTPPSPEVKWHEMVGQALLRNEGGSLRGALESQENGMADRIAQLLKGEYYLPYLPRLLDGDVDVDRCDYLIRDAQMTGVAYGRYDIDWLISTVCVAVDDGGELTLGFDAVKSPRVIEQYLVARHALYDTVYQHKTVRSAEGMVALLLQRMRDLVQGDEWPFPDEEPFLAFEKVFKQEPLSCAELLNLDDFGLWRMIMHTASKVDDPTASDLATRLLKRDLLKLVSLDDVYITNLLEAPNWKQRVIEVVHPFVRGEPLYYVHVDRRESPEWSHDPGKQAYLTQPKDGGLGRAKRARDDRDLGLVYSGRSRENRRLFVPREAVEPVRRLLTQ